MDAVKMGGYGVLAAWMLFMGGWMLTDCRDCLARGGQPVKNWWGGIACVEGRR